MALGLLKKGYLEAMRTAPPPTSPEEAAAEADAEVALLSEAQAALLEVDLLRYPFSCSFITF